MSKLKTGFVKVDREGMVLTNSSYSPCQLEIENTPSYEQAITEIHTWPLENWKKENGLTQPYETHTQIIPPTFSHRNSLKLEPT
jgi:hypothetical protein